MMPSLVLSECFKKKILIFFLIVFSYHIMILFFSHAMYIVSLELTYLMTGTLYVTQFSCSVASDSLWSHGLQHASLPCPSPAPRACSNSSPLSQWCHPTISSSIIPFSSPLQSFPASGSFPVSQFFELGAEGVQPFQWIFRTDFFRIHWFDLLAVQGTLKRLLQHHSSKASVLQSQLSLWSNSHIHTWLLEKS